MKTFQCLFMLKPISQQFLLGFCYKRGEEQTPEQIAGANGEG